jgi:hypothetical protein
MNQGHCLLCPWEEEKVSFRSLKLGENNIWITFCSLLCDSTKLINKKPPNKQKRKHFAQWRLMFFPKPC